MAEESVRQMITPKVDILQLASDGTDSLYQVQVNGRPDAELHMAPYDDHCAKIRLIRNEHTIDYILARIVGDGWLEEAHKRVSVMLRDEYPGAIVGWWTKGPKATNGN